MPQFTKLMSTSEIPVNSMKTFQFNGKKIAVINIDNSFYVVDDTCTHEQCSLGTEGFLDGSAIICGCHGASFDATNGQVMSLPATTSLTTYKTKIENDELWVEI